MNNLEEENQQLRLELAKAQRLNRKLLERVAKYRDNFLMTLWDGVEIVQNEGFLILNPPEVRLHATYQGKGEDYDVSVKDVVCIISIGRNKRVFLSKEVNGTGLNNRKTNVIDLNNGWPVLTSNLDKTKFFLCAVNQRLWVNVKYWEFDAGRLKCNEEAMGQIETTKVNLRLNSETARRFLQMQRQCREALALQIWRAHYILGDEMFMIIG